MFPINRRLTEKPNNPKFDFSNPIVKNATSLLSFDRVDSNGAPWDDAAKEFWITNTASGTTPYKKKPVNGSMHLARQDLDINGITYGSPGFGVDPRNVPVFVMLSYTILLAPTAPWQGILSITGGPRDAGPFFNRTSNGTTQLQSWIGGSRFVSPLTVGKKSLLIISWDGNGNWKCYDSNTGYWRTVTATGNGNVGYRFWLGSAYISELPVAFEHFVSSVGYTPTQSELDSLVKNPYQIFEPQTQIISIEAATLLLEQEAFRFRNDDGSEATATWKALQDINTNVNIGENVRLRVLVDTTGDQATKQYQLEYKKVGDVTWNKV